MQDRWEDEAPVLIVTVGAAAVVAGAGRVVVDLFPFFLPC